MVWQVIEVTLIQQLAVQRRELRFYPLLQRTDNSHRVYLFPALIQPPGIPRRIFLRTGRFQLRFLLFQGSVPAEGEMTP